MLGSVTHELNTWLAISPKKPTLSKHFKVVTESSLPRVVFSNTSIFALLYTNPLHSSRRRSRRVSYCCYCRPFLPAWTIWKGAWCLLVTLESSLLHTNSPGAGELSWHAQRDRGLPRMRRDEPRGLLKSFDTLWWPGHSRSHHTL